MINLAALILEVAAFRKAEVGFHLPLKRAVRTDLLGKRLWPTPSFATEKSSFRRSPGRSSLSVWIDGDQRTSHSTVKNLKSI